ncbi:heterokaryon incompatibility protein-domain-containing protein [Pyrenochaeta sp. MPI-SDFR-AT-0127]|nr:heterokaryon incompatibility protein-domain-containing protein [Pyrenochaeta sp. MPI-SDFR-AT-0127]
MGDSAARRPSNREIRVLDLLQGEKNDEVKCEVRIVDLDRSPEYEALSYVWGNYGERMKIIVSACSVFITPNLHAALIRLRYPGKIRTLWIDQLCIEQDDNIEKASQVALMRDIYRQCLRCIIWLGEISESLSNFSTHDAEAVFEFLRTVAVAENSPIHELPTLFQDTIDGENARKAFSAFAMYGNSWWTRIWTVQEAIIPMSADLIWGHLSISRDDVMLTSRLLRTHLMQSYFPQSFKHKRVQYYDLLRQLLYPVHAFNHAIHHDGPLDLLMRWRHRDATDPRDKVYALLGLVAESALPSARDCDYRITVPSLFSKVTVDLILSEENLRPLIGSSEMLHKTPKLPTWAIDFACSNRVGKRQLKWWGHSHRYRQFSACKGQALQVATSSDATILMLTGVFVDEISAVHSACSFRESEAIDDRKLYETIETCKDLLHKHYNARTQHQEYIGGGSLKSALWRTMIGDLVMAEFPVERAKATQEAFYNELVDQLALGSGTGLLYESLSGMVTNHAFFITNRGYIGIGSPETRTGDLVWVFYGGKVPFVMRNRVEGDVGEISHGLTLVGDAYVHGMMDGEAVPDTHKATTVLIY